MVKPKGSVQMKYFKSDKNSKSTEILHNPKNESSTSIKKFEVVASSSNGANKFSSRNSKQNTNTDTIWSMISNKSKKGSNANSITSDRDKRYYDMYKAMRDENK